MVMGYSGSYRATVVDAADPEGAGRLLVMVPDVYGDATAWASRSAGDPNAALPAIGDLVWVSFEQGDTDWPVWSLSESESESASDSQPGSGRQGFIGVYRGTVLDNLDPLDDHRLLVNVPEVTSQDMWATAGEEVRRSEPPDIGSVVWVEYEYGDPGYPRWTGVA